ncbi:MAG: YlmC/YmxH family sporulation protein [Oscillospiraceae bacterium]|jgi:YlmC/YmxH family sporulation protein|nr:YlmC/YmxH family sporulation protein [Oscillospiraceae bacterium]
MLCSFDDLKYKEIINIKNGAKLGFPDDIEFDVYTARVCKLLVRGRGKFFGLFGRGEDTAIAWEEIEVIGEDTILVTCEVQPPNKKPR